jgi:putative transposase
MKKKRFSEEQMVSILREADAGDKTIVELFRAHKTRDGTFYAWRRKFGQMSEATVNSHPALQLSSLWPSCRFKEAIPYD